MEAPSRIGRYHVLAPIARGGMAEVFRVKSVGVAGFEKVQALKRIARQQAVKVGAGIGFSQLMFQAPAKGNQVAGYFFMRFCGGRQNIFQLAHQRALGN